MNKALDYIDENYSYPIYLNASPMQSDGMLNLNDLTRFYEKFGFKVFKSQRGNNLMIKKSKDKTYAEGGLIEIDGKMYRVITKHRYNSDGIYEPFDIYEEVDVKSKGGSTYAEGGEIKSSTWFTKESGLSFLNW